MGMTERDQKVLAIVVAFVVLGGFWFLVVHKKQAAIKEAQAAQVTAQADLTSAQAAEAAALNIAKVKPAAYSRLLRLGKAIPVDKDFESLLVQVNDVSVNSKVTFVSLSVAPGAAAAIGATGATTCDATGATGGATPATPASPATGPTGTTGASGSTAETWVGKDRDKAKEAVKSSDSANAASDAASRAVDCADSASLTDLAAKAAGLESESYNFSFTGSFYNLKDVYDGLLDMVRVNNGRVRVTGRLLDINSITMTVSNFPELSATVAMTGYKLPGASTSSGEQVPGAAGGSLAASAAASATTAAAAPAASE